MSKHGHKVCLQVVLNLLYITNCTHLYENQMGGTVNLLFIDFFLNSDFSYFMIIFDGTIQNMLMDIKIPQSL